MLGRSFARSRITLTHFVGKAVAEMLRRHPELNAIIRRGGLYPRQTIDISFTVASDTTGQDLGAMVLRNADKKTLVEIAQEMAPVIREVREKTDPKHQVFKKILGALPLWLGRFALQTACFFLYELNLWTPLFGLPRDPFGGALVTNVGSLGLDQAFGALVPASRLPVVIAVGAVQDTAVVENGQVIAGKVIGLYFTVDHRVIDAVPAGYMSKTMKQIFADPEGELRQNSGLSKNGSSS